MKNNLKNNYIKILMIYEKYPLFTENNITFLSKLIDKKCNINIDNILTKKILKKWYDNTSKLYEFKIKNNKKLKNIKKNKNYLYKLIENFSKKYPDKTKYNTKFYQKELIILDNMTPSQYKDDNEKKFKKYNDINNKLNNDKNYRLSIINN